MVAADPRNTRRWKALARSICPPGSICALCGKPIIHGLRRGHPLGPSADHIIPWSRGGDPYDPHNLRPAHFGCNSSRGNRTTPPPAERFSEQW